MFLEIFGWGMYCDKICPGDMIYGEVTRENLKRKCLGRGNNLKMNEAGNRYIWCAIHKSNAFTFCHKIHALFPLCLLNESQKESEVATEFLMTGL
jgi:hypothetical protein